MIFFDTETTGLIKNVALPLNRQPKIIEIGCIREPNIKGRSRFFEATFNPGFKLDPVITKITGLTDADLAEQPRFGEHIDDRIGSLRPTHGVVDGVRRVIDG